MKAGLVAVLAPVAGLAAAGDAVISDVPRLPDLAGVEKAVADRLRERSAAAGREKSSAAWFDWARALHAAHFFAEAVEAYAVAAPTAAPAERFKILHLGGCALASDPRAASDWLRMALVLRDDYAPAHLRLAESLERLGQAEEAARHYRRALDLGSGARARLGLGRLALAGGRLDVAIAELEQARELEPRNEAVAEALSRALARSGQTEEARRMARLAGSLRNRAPIVDPLLEMVTGEDVSCGGLRERARALAGAGRLDDALAASASAIACAPASDVAREDRAGILIDLGRPAEALRGLTEVRSSAARPERLDLSGQCRALLGDLAGAERDLRRAVELAPHQPLFRFNLARVLQALHPDRALVEALEAVRLDPADSGSRLLAAELLAQLGRRDESRRQLQELLALEPGNRLARDHLVRLGAAAEPAPSTSGSGAAER